MTELRRLIRDAIAADRMGHYNLLADHLVAIRRIHTPNDTDVTNDTRRFMRRVVRLINRYSVDRSTP